MVEYVLEGQKWASNTVTWTFADPTTNPTDGFSSGITNSAQQAAVEQSLQAWAQASGLHLEQVADTTAATPDLLIGYGDFNAYNTGQVGDTGYAWDGSNHFIPGTVVRMEDPAETPLIPGANGSLWYQGFINVSLAQDALHEIGHSLGMAHDQDPASIMNPGLGASNQTLDATDIAGIRAIYPDATPPGTDTLLASGPTASPPASPPPSPPPTTPPPSTSPSTPPSPPPSTGGSNTGGHHRHHHHESHGAVTATTTPLSMAQTLASAGVSRADFPHAPAMGGMSAPRLGAATMAGGGHDFGQSQGGWVAPPRMPESGSLG